MELAEVLFLVGALGFASAFQVIGVGACRVFGEIWSKASGVKEHGAAAFMFVCAAPFLALPFAIADAFGGWLPVTAQAAVLFMLMAFVFTPYKNAPAPTKTGKLPGFLNGDVTATPLRLSTRIFAAIPALLTAAAFGANLAGASPLGLTQRGLCALHEIEFLVIHSFPFLALVTLPRIRHLRWRIYLWFLFVTWFCLYLAFAARDHGLTGVAAFISCTAATYLGFILRRSCPKRILILIKRWGVSLLLLLTCSAVAGASRQEISDAALRLGLAYFLLLGLAELAGLYEQQWLKLPGRLLRRIQGKRLTVTPSPKPAEPELSRR